MKYTPETSYTTSDGHVMTNFAEVSMRGYKAGKCLCGKRRVRKERFWGTVNPYNRNPDGSIKTREQVAEKVKAEHDAWMKEPIVCDNCPARNS